MMKQKIELLLIVVTGLIIFITSLVFSPLWFKLIIVGLLVISLFNPIKYAINMLHRIKRARKNIKRAEKILGAAMAHAAQKAGREPSTKQKKSLADIKTEYSKSNGSRNAGNKK